YKIFTKTWLQRAERGKEYIDDGDRFISLWIAFNGWMKGKFGEAVKDSTLVKRVKESGEIQQKFEDMKNNERFVALLKKLSKYTVTDMRYPNDSCRSKGYGGNLASLMDVIYQVRCNLFHGRKDVEGDQKDIELVSLSYQILLLLLKECLGSQRGAKPLLQKLPLPLSKGKGIQGIGLII
ncbi:MAG: hypothetical protein HYY80_05035, partial [Chloroflexi bacterium]|nr:hypothetical protein [Chloroflexota bacterium]